MKKSLPLAALLGTAPMAALVCAGSLIGVSNDAQAAPVGATLVSVVNYFDYAYQNSIPGGLKGSVAFNLSLSTATWTFDAGTGEAAMTGGTYVGEILSPNFFGHTMTGVTLGNYVPTLGTWSCQEGVFAPAAIKGSLCGNYQFGSNKINQSTYTPSAQGATVTLGGDDTAFFSPNDAPQTLQTSYSNMTTVSLGGGLYALTNASAGFGNTNSKSGYDFVFQQDLSPVPVPAAVWLFGSALGLMGVMRRRKSA